MAEVDEVEMAEAKKGDGVEVKPKLEHSETTVPPGIGKSPEDAKRGCRDILCLIFFILCWGCFIAVLIIGFVLGDPKRCVQT